MTSVTYKFDDKQKHQLKAINAVVDVFEWEDFRDGRFTVPKIQNSVDDTWRLLTSGTVTPDTDVIWVANKLTLDKEDLLKNVYEIQDRNWLARSKSLIDPDYEVPNFTIEMETGTGKTYVYTRTALELHKKYGFKKFVIVVPSVAIREWVYESLKNTEEHFHQLYGTGVKFFKYNSDQLSDIKEYAESDIVQIMIMNIDAFRVITVKEDKKWNVKKIHSDDNEDFRWVKPIDVLRSTNPIVIIDEPQSVDNTDKAKESIQALNPMCILRYSATHKKKINLMYQLGPVEAYEQKLVKHIQVLEVETEWDMNKPYMKLISVEKKDGLWFSAQVELDIQDKKWKIKRKIAKVNTSKKSNMFLISGERNMYDWYIVANIDCTEWAESLTFLDGSKLRVWEIRWATNDVQMKRAQIRWTIQTHLDRERDLLSRWIKVISLFFLDRVDKYRSYDEEGNRVAWDYAVIFEEEYNKAIKLPKYQTLFETEERKQMLDVPVEKIHDGYFSIDGKWKMKDSKEWWGNKDDYSTYERIVQNTKLLLSFDDPIRFIFSHSALREWWDNPNVFQICTLVDTVDPFTKRQKIWRGLRLPVNQKWERIRDKNINVLTVVANESYEMFAKNLQNEIEKATGIKFGYLEIQMFAKIEYKDDKWKVTPMWFWNSEKLFKHLTEKLYIKPNGKTNDSLKEAIDADTLELPKEFEHPDVRKKIVKEIKDRFKTIKISNASESVEVKRNETAYEMSQEFRLLWDKIKYKTRYNINFDIAELVKMCTYKIKQMPPVPASKMFLKVSKLWIKKKWITAGDPQTIAVLQQWWYRSELPDIVRYLEDQTNLKRSTIVRMLVDSLRIERDFIVNPQKFMEQVAQIINEEKQKLVVSWVTYEQIEDLYDQNIFEKEMKWYANNTVQVERSLYSHVIFDSEVEEKFANALSVNENLVKFFIKLPPKFLIDTPLGGYNPDRAVLMEKDWVEKLYFVVETKSTELEAQRRWNENSKITCGKKHFEAISDGAVYETATSWDGFVGKI